MRVLRVRVTVHVVYHLQVLSDQTSESGGNRFFGLI
jgi:hypothetical protein